MDLGLKNKLALVTGSTAGIGFAIAKGLLEEGAKVVISGRTQQRLDEAVAKLKSAGNALGAVGDMSIAAGGGRGGGGGEGFLLAGPPGPNNGRFLLERRGR